ncbi:hypothetical protein IGI04_025995, partial [Brassica rapa subsp. trilocularis]
VKVDIAQPNLKPNPKIGKYLISQPIRLHKAAVKVDKNSGNNASLMAIASTLDKLSSKFDLMDARFKKPLVDQKSIDDMVKVAVEERLKVMGIGKNSQNKENLSNVAADQQPEPLSSPQPNTQQKSVCSPLLAETLGKDMGPRNNLSNELDKERGMKKLWLRSLEHMLKMRATKAEDLLRRSTRNRTIKDEDAEDKKKTVQAEAVLKKKEKAATKRKADASMKQKQHELKKPKQAELMNEEQAELKNQEQAELMNEELAELKNQEADNEKRKNITTPRANLKRCKVEDSVEDSEFAVMTDEVLAEENEILPDAQCHKSKPSLSDQVAMEGSKRSMKRHMEDVYGADAVEGYNKGKMETTEHYRALLRLAKEQRQSESEWNDASSKHCEAEAELGDVKVIDPDWCKLHEKWMLDD